jgi:pantoate kinase
VIGVRPGAPPWGKWKRIPVGLDVKVVCYTLGPLPTSRLLREADFRARAKTLGIHAMRKLLRGPTLDNFIRISNEFSEKLGLLDDELRSLMGAARGAGALGASQVMLGRAVFAFAKQKRAASVRRAFTELAGPEKILVTEIDRAGARLYPDLGDQHPRATPAA